AGAANVVFGYRIGMLAAGGGALILADQLNWFWSYVAMAGLMLVGIATTLLNPEPDARVGDAVDAEAAAAFETQSTWKKIGAWWRSAAISPLADFMTRRAWLLILLFVIFYKYGDALLGAMANPFYLDIGFTKTEIGLVSKFYGLAMTLIGVFFGGVLVARIGILRSLLIAGILQAGSNLVFAAQALVGDSLPFLAVTISVENLTGGLATAAFVAYISSLCNVAYTATQYALLSSFSSVGRTFLASVGGWLADHMTWFAFFLVTTVAAAPGLVLLVWMMRIFPPDATAASVATADSPGSTA
ncbi:MAG: MFS transporter, partial [Thermoanaerobaculia bacterium]|nr:MFS transporter [Thermoanaerobaculia bacterium]